MGFIFSKAWNKLFEKRDVRILMIGLDAAGKTTIMYKIKMNETVKTIPTIGFNLESLEYKGLKMTMWDIGGQDKLRDLWKHYYEGTDALIYVVDSNDRDRADLNMETLQTLLLEPALKDACLLVFANKQDLSGSMTPSEIVDKMELNKLKGREWIVQGASATRGEGLTEGLDWIAKTLLKRK
jgi:small GTP-binding protein